MKIPEWYCMCVDFWWILPSHQCSHSLATPVLMRTTTSVRRRQNAQHQLRTARPLSEVRIVLLQSHCFLLCFLTYVFKYFGKSNVTQLSGRVVVQSLHIVAFVFQRVISSLELVRKSASTTFSRTAAMKTFAKTEASLSFLFRLLFNQNSMNMTHVTILSLICPVLSRVSMKTRKVALFGICFKIIKWKMNKSLNWSHQFGAHTVLHNQHAHEGLMLLNPYEWVHWHSVAHMCWCTWSVCLDLKTKQWKSAWCVVHI